VKEKKHLESGSTLIVWHSVHCTSMLLLDLGIWDELGLISVLPLVHLT
jgi:hypothetical protein